MFRVTLNQRPRWRRRILVPAWIAQAALMLAILSIFSYRLAHTVSSFDADHKAGKTPTVELVWESTNVGLGLLCVILTAFEAHRLRAETLTPFFLLACNVLKMTGAAAILALDVVVYTQRTDGNWSTIGLALDAAALAAMLALGIYSIVVFRRLASSDDEYYTQSNVKSFGFGNSYNPHNPYNPYNPYDPNDGVELVPNSAAMGRAVPYDYSYRGAAAEYGAARSAALPVGGGRLSFSGRDRAASAASANTISATTAAVQPRRLSYNHERDTQFDAYVSSARAASAGTGPGGVPLSKGAIDGALSAELWGQPTADRSNSLVGMGVVAATTPHREVVNRTTSWSVEHGVAGPGTPGTPMIPELEEDDYMTRSKAKAAAAQEKSALLTGHERDVELEDNGHGPIPETIHS